MRRDRINDGDLELYALDRLAEPDAAPVEEHLLICEQCQARLAGWDEYVRAMRAAMKPITGQVKRRSRTGLQCDPVAAVGTLDF
jgi:anti-sigma factor RsiW